MSKIVPTLVYVVMGGGIVVGAYRRCEIAMRHAKCITGCDVVPLDMSSLPPALRAIVESQILNELPPEIMDDIQSEWEGDDDVTPEIALEHEIEDEWDH